MTLMYLKQLISWKKSKNSKDCNDHLLCCLVIFVPILGCFSNIFSRNIPIHVLDFIHLVVNGRG